MSTILIPCIGYELSKLLLNFPIFPNQKPKETVYVVGNGWGAYYFVKNLDKRKFKPIIIAPNTKVLDTPKLIDRVINPEAIVEFDNPYGEIITDSVKDIDVKSKKIITNTNRTFKYKYVVLSIGSESNDFGIGGVSNHTCKLKTIQDADNLHGIISKLDKPTQIMIVGTGPTGIELASKLSTGKFSDITLIEGFPDILGGFSIKSKEKIKIHLEQNQIKLNVNSMVKLIDKTNIHISITNKEIKSKLLNYGIAIWVGGIRLNGYSITPLANTLAKISLANQINNKINNKINPRGLDVNENFTLGLETDLYCIGDMVGNKGIPTAQTATNHGVWLAGYFNSNFDPKYLEYKPYKIKSKGTLLHLKDSLYLESEYYSGHLPNILKCIDLYRL